MKSVIETQQELVQSLQALGDWEDRYKLIIEWGKALPALPDDLKQEKFRVRGCQSQVWLVPSLTSDGLVSFRMDSDAILVKGLAAMVLQVFSERTPKEILDTSLEFLTDMGLTQHLSQSRSNGLASMIKQIKQYAVAYAHVLAGQS